ncbi:MAG: HDOD domain-containing protein [Gammaproteobacteria bacterium]|nr:HDOD domain-containing protein [Gammaproteobacteria bacterium]
MSFQTQLVAYLKQSEIKFNLIDLNTYQNKHNPSVRQLQLQHSLNTALVAQADQTYVLVWPANYGIDFDLLNAQLQSQLTIKPAAEFKQTRHIDQLAPIPPVEALLSCALVIDTQVLHSPLLFFPSGVQDHVIEISGSDFIRLNATAKVLHFAHKQHGFARYQQLKAQFGNTQTITTEKIENPLHSRQLKSQRPIHIGPRPAVTELLINLWPEPDSVLQTFLPRILLKHAKLQQQTQFLVHTWFSQQDLKKLPIRAEASIALSLSIIMSFQGLVEGPLSKQQWLTDRIYCSLIAANLKPSIVDDPIRLSEIILLSFLNDIGLLLLSDLFPVPMQLVNRLLQLQHTSDINALVQKVIGIDFIQASIAMLKAWEFPPKIIQYFTLASPLNEQQNDVLKRFYWALVINNKINHAVSKTSFTPLNPQAMQFVPPEDDQLMASYRVVAQKKQSIALFLQQIAA